MVVTKHEIDESCVCQIHIEIYWTLWCYDKSLATHVKFDALALICYSLAQYNGYLKAL